ncbi:hypothetical protein HPB47_017572 [Ixodes persulcatus]|uniref:Uncharacterized protein n=1 Tax=Ixodes persulcatus TaxID=34615 RepID=A0AC60QRI3_IXOPE|nr:hypothetical protein HPB47_017572 [Ixodes persulcatus]
MTNDEKKINNKALTFMFLVVEDTYLDDIEECSTAREAWNTLEEIHSKCGLLHALQLMRDFFKTRMKPEETMKDYLGRIMNLHRTLSTAGYAFTDREVALVMLMGLSEAYEPLILNLEQDEGTLMTKKVKAWLLVEEKRQAKREEDKLNDSEENKALMTKNKPITQSSQLHKHNGQEHFLRKEATGTGTRSF